MNFALMKDYLKVSGHEGQKIRIGICGYGNLGRGVLNALQFVDDMDPVVVFTRRDTNAVSMDVYNSGYDVPVVDVDNAKLYRNDLDVVIMCGGSAKDLPHQTPRMARYFNVVDSFDTHADIEKHLSMVDTFARWSGEYANPRSTTAIISGGWDPGLFSIMRCYFNAVMPQSNVYTFWGTGVSQGHSDAVRRIDGVKAAIQYTIPSKDLMDKVALAGALDGDEAKPHRMHGRVVYVVAKKGTDLDRIEREIKEMPKYFADYNTEVHFISMAEYNKKFAGHMEHGGVVMGTGNTCLDSEQSHLERMKFQLDLDSNPEFTASVLIALARACFRMNQMDWTGAYTVLEIPPVLWLPISEEKQWIKLV